MKIIRVLFDQTIGFDELYEGYLLSVIESEINSFIIEGDTVKQYNEDTTHITPRNEVVL